MSTENLEVGVNLKELFQIHTGQTLGQCRAVPVNINAGSEMAVLAIYCADFDIDPFEEMFFFPQDTLKMILFNSNGEVLWKRDLGRGVVPGVWFCPVFAFDLDGDGVDEIWFVNNAKPEHPLALRNYHLERMNPQTGETTGQWKWPAYDCDQTPSHLYRNFIVGGHVKGEPVLVTAQGTYGSMFIQGWNSDMSIRWEHVIDKNAPGARGSHMCPITDLDGDGIEELMWGERCIELDSGKELFCADRDVYNGHSDIIQPFLDKKCGKWFIFTCRESEHETAPRVALYDSTGNRVWSDVEHGHMDLGWVARVGENGENIAAAIRIVGKSCGPDGRHHSGLSEFTYNALSGEPYTLPFSAYRMIPVDLNGDGYHELVRGAPSGNGEVIDRFGNAIGNVGGPVALASKFFDYPGEQILSYSEDGVLHIWADQNAKDSETAKARYNHPFYKANQRIMANGYNWWVLSGI